MVGQLGEKSVAAVGLATQVFFIFSFLLFGISSGAGIFTAQLWGKKDQASIRKVLALASCWDWRGSIFLELAWLAPRSSWGFTRKTPVVELGTQYLRIIGWSYPITPVTFSFASVLRSTGNVQVPTFVSIRAHRWMRC